MNNQLFTSLETSTAGQTGIEQLRISDRQKPSLLFSFNRIQKPTPEFSDDDDDEDIPRMPKPGTPEAPLFDGSDVEGFLKDMKRLAIRCQIDSRRLAIILPKYCISPIELALRSSIVYKLQKWSSIKNFMINIYGDQEDAPVTADSLSEITQADWSANTVNSLATEYKEVSNFLIERGEITEDDAVRMLISVIPRRNLCTSFMARGERIKTNGWISLEKVIKLIRVIFQLKSSNQHFTNNYKNETKIATKNI